MAAERSNPEPVDSETRASADDHLALRLWLRLLACTNRIEAPLRTRLREQFDGSLPRFDLMAQLDREPEGMKMRELSRRLMVTGGNVTGLTNRLVTEGLVDKRSDSADGRAVTVQLTAEGRRQFRVMAKAHEAWVVELLGGLSAAEQAQLFELLGRLKTGVTRD
jgi:DNA-binding MarR family transcriptional regulator